VTLLAQTSTKSSCEASFVIRFLLKHTIMAAAMVELVDTRDFEEFSA